MKLIVGLGNPGRKYEGTRHNVGFQVTAELARRWALGAPRRGFSGHHVAGRFAGERVCLLEPGTYMNLSGRSVREAMTFHKLGLADLLIAVDDMALPLGALRLRSRGSAGGHNGLANIIAELGGDGFARLRIGIDAPGATGGIGHVLGAFSPEEKAQIEKAVERAADAAACWVTEGIDSAMNRYNRPEDE